jgi:hypothetical protein
LRERVGVRGIETKKLEIQKPFYPHPSLPHPGGGEILAQKAAGSIEMSFIIPTNCIRSLFEMLLD